MTSAVSVVIAAKNAEDTLAEQLEALVAQPWPHGGEILVADNGSTDGTKDQVERFAHSEIPISLIDASDAPGAGHARNRGVERARHDYIAFCDADDIVGDGWIASLSDALDDAPAVGGRLELARLNPEWMTTSRGHVQPTNTLPTFDGVFPVLSSSNLGIHRTLFTSLGGFDESFIRGQDAELSLRLHLAGTPTEFASDAIVHYRLRTTPRQVYRQAKGWGEIHSRLRSRLPEGDAVKTRTLRSWIWLFIHPHYLFNKAGRARLAYVAGIRVGTARGRRSHRRQS